MTQVATVITTVGEDRGVKMGRRPHDRYHPFGLDCMQPVGLGDNLHSLSQGCVAAPGQHVIDQNRASPAATRAAQGLNTAVTVAVMGF